MATTAADPMFVDTNVLIAANVASHPKHAPALQRLKDLASAGADLWISRQVLREYLATLTRPQTFSVPQPVSLLQTQVVYFQNQFKVADDTASVTANLLALLVAIPVGGKQVHDANIVATMQVYGITQLLTDNTTDFARFEPTITVVPLVPAP